MSPRAMFSQRREGAVVSEPSEDFSSLGASAGGASFGGASIAQEAAHNAMLASHRWGDGGAVLGGGWGEGFFPPG